ncbi:glycosyl transferase family 21 [Prauserella shujinwangii]|uniref:Glycosyl transferase family 21 n=1 Tax=Prauserella shujinwangii TaxID=1453103 RepID=A0A2T0LSI5_9PSEU|nr:glycosyltransferase [Prauserella shujinwangii]PRX46575.1 glycosyl transferase family 21 [Prauserella shujinwangii]
MRAPRPPRAAAALLRLDALRAAGGIEAIRGAVIDDVALARAVKRAGGRLWLGPADDVRSVRPYPGLAGLWRMVARSAYAQLRYSPWLLLATVAGLALVFLAPPVTAVTGAVTGSVPALLAGGTAWAIMAGTYAPALRYHGLPVACAPLLPGVALLYLLMTMDSAVRHWRGLGVEWKGRSYAARGRG